jgi:hypothetical protein
MGAGVPAQLPDRGGLLIRQGEPASRDRHSQAAAAFPITPPDMRVRVQWFGGLSYRQPGKRGIPGESIRG